MSPASPVTGPSRQGRRAQRLSRQRARNRRIAVLAGGCAVLSLAVATVFFVTRGGEQARSYGPPVRTQHTLLMELHRASEVVSAVLLSHDSVAGGTGGAAVLLPPTVVVAVPGSGTTTLSASLVTGRPQAARDAVADLLGVTVDAGWVLDPATLAHVVDRVGGVRVEVDADVLQGNARILTKGEQRLSGVQAVSYATYLGVGETEPARLVRLQATLDALLLALPEGPGLSTLLGGLGGGSQSSLPVAQLADFLGGLARDTKAHDLQYNLLPVVAIDPGNGVSSYRVDAAPLGALVDRLFGPSVPAGRRESGNRVFVSNGVGTPGIGATVRGVLVEAGFVFVGSRNAPTFGRPKTVLLVRDATIGQQALGLRVARALRVPDASVQVSTEVGTTADVIVVVGRDYAPATKP